MVNLRILFFIALIGSSCEVKKNPAIEDDVSGRSDNVLLDEIVKRVKNRRKSEENKKFSEDKISLPVFVRTSPDDEYEYRRRWDIIGHVAYLQGEIQLRNKLYPDWLYLEKDRNFYRDSAVYATPKIYTVFDSLDFKKVKYIGHNKKYKVYETVIGINNFKARYHVNSNNIIVAGDSPLNVSLFYEENIMDLISSYLGSPKTRFTENYKLWEWEDKTRSNYMIHSVYWTHREGYRYGVSVAPNLKLF